MLGLGLSITKALSTLGAVIKTNLKMWLGFETSETLGREEVVNGYFSDGTTSWSEEANSTISIGTYEGKTDVAIINITDTSTLSKIEQAFDYVNGQSYQVSVEVYLVSGSFRVDSRDSFVPVDFVSTTTTGSWQTLTATITAIKTGTDVVWLRGINAVSQFYVNSISIKKLTQITPDKSGNNNVGELFTGKALDFDGSNDYVDLGSQSNPATNMTFACWLNPVVSGSTSNQSIIDYGKFNVWLKDNDTLVVYTNSGASPVSYAISDLNNKWSRLVVSVSGTTTSVYIDSTLIAAKTTPALSAGDNTSVIGREGTSNYYDGKLSDLQVYNVAWTQADVTFDYDNPQNLVTDRAASTIVLSNLKGYWHLSEGAGSTVYDSSGQDNNGTIDGATYEPAQPRIPQLGMMNFSNGEVATGVTLIPDPNNISQDIDGNPVRDRLNSLNLDGTGYAKVVDDDTINPTEAITVECWVYWINTVTDKGLVAKWSNDDDFQDYMLYKETSTKFLFYIGAQAKRCDTALSNGWNHIVGTYDRTTMRLYVNGLADGTLAHTSAIPNTTQVLEIGRYRETANRTYSERIDDARIYDRALSATEVLKNYNAGLSAHTN